METVTSTHSGATGISWLGVVTSPVKIVGAGPESTILHCRDANNGNRAGILLNHADSSLSGVTVKGGYVYGTSRNGTAVRIVSGTMSNCVITANNPISGKDRSFSPLSLESTSAYAYDSEIVGNNLGTGAQAPAVYVYYGTLVRCRIADNKSGDYASANALAILYGAAIDCLIEGNSGNSVSVASGAVTLDYGAKLLGCTIRNNANSSRCQRAVSNSSAGALYVAGQYVVVSNCVISGNANYSSTGINAAGVAVASINAKIYDTEISENFSPNGAELIMTGNSLVTNCVIRNTRGYQLVDRRAGQVLDCILEDGSDIVDDRPAVCYVSTTGSATFPYDTLEKATADIQAAVDAVAKGGRVVVAPGTYNNTSPLVERKFGIKHSLLVDKAVSIEGPADPSEAVFHMENIGSAKTQGAGFWIAHPGRHALRRNDYRSRPPGG